jgi:hypothetical protein
MKSEYGDSIVLWISTESPCSLESIAKQFLGFFCRRTKALGEPLKSVPCNPQVAQIPLTARRLHKNKQRWIIG